MRAGTCSIPLPLAPGLPMMGYGARQAPARDLHDPLHARALYLESEPERVLLISLEVCLIAPRQAEEIAERVAAASGLDPAAILVTCIHTHSGPETGFGALISGEEPPAYVAGWLDAACEAGTAAVARAEPASLGTGVGRAGIGRNRRRADGPIDPRVRVVRVDRTDGRPLAVVYAHGCHPTVLGHDNLSWSADWPWAAGRAIEEAWPGVMPLFLLSAHADVDPRTRGLQDLAKRAQSVGVGFEQVEALGREVGDEVVRVARGIHPSRDAVLGIRRGSTRLHAHAPGPGDREAALEALGLSESERPSAADWYRLEGERTEGLAEAERRDRIARVRHYLRNRSARRFAFGEEPEVDAWWLRLGELRFLGVPLEATVDVGRAWSERTGRETDGVLSIAGGWMRYLPHRKNFEEPGAERAYEVLQSTFEPGAADQLLQLGLRLEAGQTVKPAAS